MEDKYDDWNAEGNLPEINTCPFCSGEGILCDNGHEEPVIDSNGAYVDMEFFEGDDFWCECKVCGAMTHGEDTPEDAIMVWNKRA